MEKGGSPPPDAVMTNGDAEMNPVSPSAAGDVELPADSEQQQHHQQPSPAKGKGRAKGRGNARGRAKGAKTAQQKPAPKPATTGRGRRQKVYDSLTVQAAYERMQELKSNFTSVAKMVKPALQELAERTITRLSKEEKNLPNEPETAEIQRFLDKRREDALEVAATELEAGEDMALRVWQGNCYSVTGGYEVSNFLPIRGWLRDLGTG
jgi:hypothetical protein